MLRPKRRQDAGRAKDVAGGPKLDDQDALGNRFADVAALTGAAVVFVRRARCTPREVAALNTHGMLQRWIAWSAPPGLRQRGRCRRKRGRSASSLTAPRLLVHDWRARTPGRGSGERGPRRLPAPDPNRRAERSVRARRRGLRSRAPSIQRALPWP